MRNFSVELLRQSPSPALRECCKLAQVCIQAWHTAAFFWGGRGLYHRSSVTQAQLA